MRLLHIQSDTLFLPKDRSLLIPCTKGTETQRDTVIHATSSQKCEARMMSHVFLLSKWVCISLSLSSNLLCLIVKYQLQDGAFHVMRISAMELSLCYISCQLQEDESYLSLSVCVNHKLECSSWKQGLMTSVNRLFEKHYKNGCMSDSLL